MEGLLFLIACVVIGVLVLWVIQNDAAGPTEETSGLFAMRSDRSTPTADRKERQRRAGRRVTRG